jgi:hypothetical protein
LRTTHRLFTATLRFAGLRRFEDPHFHDRLRLAQTSLSIGQGVITGGFGTWNGTSFAAPILAGRIAQRLFDSGAAADSSAATKRAWAVLEEQTSLRSES